MENVNITDFISEQNGGQVIVEVSSTGVNSGPCDKEGFPLYTRMLLQEALLPRQDRLSVWVIIGAILGGLMLLIVVLWLVFVKCVRRPRSAAVYSSAGESGGAIEEAKVDVESCAENEDNADDRLFAVVEPSSVLELPVERSMARNLAKVVPVESDLEMQDMEEAGAGVVVGRPPPKGPRPPGVQDETDSSSKHGQERLAIEEFDD